MADSFRSLLTREQWELIDEARAEDKVWSADCTGREGERVEVPSSRGGGR